MSTYRTVTRWSAALVGVALACVCLAAPATARDDDAYLLYKPAPGVAGCALERIGVQFVRCDNLTGAGVAAPSYVPEAG